jgi:hypothetical protein
MADLGAVARSGSYTNDTTNAPVGGSSDIALATSLVLGGAQLFTTAPFVPPPPPLDLGDLIERAKIAIVAVLDTHPQIVAITGRSSGNLIPWDAETETDLPVIAYRVTVATRGGAAPATGDSREIMFLFSAVAADDAQSHALLEVIEGGIAPPDVVWSVELATLPQPFDGYFMNPVRREVGWDSDADGYRNDLEYTLIATK